MIILTLKLTVAGTNMLLIYRSLAVPLWILVFFVVAFTPPTPRTEVSMPLITLFAIAAVGLAAIACDFVVATYRSLVGVLPPAAAVSRPVIFVS
jgi:hypothetical protein